jgi:hypothetical protein
MKELEIRVYYSINTSEFKIVGKWRELS